MYNLMPENNIIIENFDTISLFMVYKIIVIDEHVISYLNINKVLVKYT